MGRVRLHFPYMLEKYRLSERKTLSVKMSAKGGETVDKHTTILK
jgi:hypothetical protein